MARMLPATIPPDLPSHAEAALFAVIESGLGAEWTALHSLGLGSHPNKPWAEIDYVLIGPPGVFCLEVKGGRLAREEGQWLYTDRYGHTTSRREGPFEQVAPAATALHRYLAGRLPWADGMVVGYGVVTPDITFAVTGPDIVPEVIYDARDVKRPFAAYVRRLAEHWQAWKAARQARPVQALSAAERMAVVAELRADFHLYPSLRTQVGLATDELLQLTQEQYTYIHALADNPRAIIRGGAGTGKTLLAVEEARRRAALGERVFLCCFNRRLGLYLQRALQDCPGVEAGHLHGLMVSTVQQAGLAGRLPPADDPGYFDLHYPKLCLEALFELERAEAYDALIVDEAQDLLLEWYVEVLDTLLAGGIARGRWRAFLDPYQDIFRAGEGLGRLLAAHPVHYRLTINCRNTAPIAAATQQVSGVDCGRTRVSTGPEVECIWYRDQAQQRREISRCLNRLLSGGLQPGQITILSRHRRENSCLQDGLEGVPYPLVEVEGPLPEAEPAIRFATIPAFKGLEADAVLLFDLDDLEGEDALLRNYVGASRARALLVLFLDERVREAYERRGNAQASSSLPPSSPHSGASG